MKYLRRRRQRVSASGQVTKEKFSEEIATVLLVTLLALGRVLLCFTLPVVLVLALQPLEHLGVVPRVLEQYLVYLLHLEGTTIHGIVEDVRAIAQRPMRPQIVKSGKSQSDSLKAAGLGK